MKSKDGTTALAMKFGGEGYFGGGGCTVNRNSVQKTWAQKNEKLFWNFDAMSLCKETNTKIKTPRPGNEQKKLINV